MLSKVDMPRTLSIAGRERICRIQHTDIQTVLYVQSTSQPTPTRRYGSYGACIDPGFHKLILPYLDRGMIYAIAHIRGGGEMGRFWCVRANVTA